MRRGQTWKQLAANLFLSGISTVLVLGLLVGGGRRLGKQLNAWGYFKAVRPNLDLNYDTNEYRIKVHISEQGLRGKEVEVPKPEGMKRWLALGDSFTFGYGVADEQTWVKLVEDGLKQAGAQVEIVNGGIPGIGVTRSRWVCRAYTDRLEIDGFIVGVYLDDLFQAIARDMEETRLEKVVSWIWPSLYRAGKPVIEEMEISRETREKEILVSEVWKNDVNQALRRHPEMLLAIDPKVRNDFVRGRINPYLIYRSFQNPDFLIMPLDEWFYTESLKAWAEELKLMQQGCIKDKPTVVVFFPPGSWVNQKYHRYREELGFKLDPRVLTAPVDEGIGKIVQNQGWEWLSLLSDFRADGCDNCYFPYDGHLTQEGNRRAAEIILPQLLAELDEFLAGN